MSELMNRALPFIQVLSKSKPVIQKAIFKHGPKEVIDALSEIILNVLKGVVVLNSRQKRYLSRYKRGLRALTQKKVPVRRKRKFLEQKGSGIFSFLAPIVLPMLFEELLGEDLF